MLSQGEIGKDLPIAFASRSLNQAEKNYSTTEKEALALVYAVEQFRPYLFGQKFTLLSDHCPLSYLTRTKKPTPRLVRWRIRLEKYDYEIAFLSGAKNVVADALSRNPADMPTDVEEKNEETKIF